MSHDSLLSAVSARVRSVAGGGGGGCSRVFKVENSFRASVAPLIFSLKKVFLAAVMLDEKEASSVWELARASSAADLCHFLSAALRLERCVRRVSLSHE